VTAENINDLLQKYEVPVSFDLLSIDLDGNDYWVWRAVRRRPRVVVIEYNAHIGPADSRVIAYDPAFRWAGTDYFGASLRALRDLGQQKGYALVYCESTGTNAFFVAAVGAVTHRTGRESWWTPRGSTRHSGVPQAQRQVENASWVIACKAGGCQRGSASYSRTSGERPVDGACTRSEEVPPTQSRHRRRG